MRMQVSHAHAHEQLLIIVPPWRSSACTEMYPLIFINGMSLGQARLSFCRRILQLLGKLQQPRLPECAPRQLPHKKFNPHLSLSKARMPVRKLSKVPWIPSESLMICAQDMATLSNDQLKPKHVPSSVNMESTHIWKSGTIKGSDVASRGIHAGKAAVLEHEAPEGWQIVGDVCERQPDASASPQMAQAYASSAFPMATHRKLSKVRSSYQACIYDPAVPLPAIACFLGKRRRPQIEPVLSEYLIGHTRPAVADIAMAQALDA